MDKNKGISIEKAKALPILFSIPIYAGGTALWKQAKIYWLIIAVAFIIIWSATYPGWYKKLIKKETKKLLNEGDNSSIFGEKTILIEDGSIKITGKFIRETILKESIKDIKIYDDMILIYLSSVTAQVIPTRCLDEESKKDLINRLNNIVKTSSLSGE